MQISHLKCHLSFLKSFKNAFRAYHSSVCYDLIMWQARIFRHHWCVCISHYIWIVSGASWAMCHFMCALALHSESQHCSSQVDSIFRVKNSSLQMLVNSSGNHANGFRGVCTLGRWTHLQHCMVLESGALEGWGWWQITLYSRTFTGVWLAWEAAVSKLWGFMDKR